MAAVLLPFITMATEVTCITDSVINDQTAVIEEASQAATVTDVPMNAVDTVSEQATVEYFMEDKSILEDPNMYRKYHGVDFHFLKNTTNYSIKPYTFMQDQTWVGIPVFIAGWIAKSEKKAFQQNYKNSNTRIRLIKYNFHSEVDNYTQFSGIALTAGLKMAGVEGRSSWPRLIASSLASYGVMAAFVNGIKYSAKEMRPDESTKNSWPSGHTATAFVGATILHKEYGLTRSPWYSIAGYTVATATGVMRVLNNRHWISDVLSGAGIGILSTELAYGICDLLFKDRGLLMNDLNIHPDLSKNPSFFAISMGLGFGNKHLVLPDFDFEGYGVEHDDKPMSLEFGNATAVGVEAAYFFNRYIGVGARLRVKATPIKKWSAFATDEEIIMKEKFEASELWDGVQYLRLKVQSDHITEFAADAGIYFNLPLSSRFALGTKVLAGRSVMDDVDVDGILKGFKMKRVNGRFVPTDYYIDTKWDYINLSATNSFKFGSGLSLTYAHKNSFSWRVFLDYDYASKTYTASYSPLKVIEVFAPQILEQFEGYNWNPAMTFKSSIHKHLHQWVAGGAMCVSF
ncbi:MAG: phosphatase PAP2 family protein [Muribaculaceae bacterium]|nr:phosphatase PAP2 family protein [Muribaculaceae bacterium]